MAIANIGVSKNSFETIISTGIEKVLTQFGESFVSDLGKSLENKKDTTGRLRHSIHFNIKVFTEHYEFKILLEDYYKWVDEGRKPNSKRPPIKDILTWISKKGIGFNTKKGLKIVAEDFKKQKSLAYLISTSIAKKGIKPTNFFSKVKKDGRIDKLKKSLQGELKKGVIVYLKEI